MQKYHRHFPKPNASNKNSSLGSSAAQHCGLSSFNCTRNASELRAPCSSRTLSHGKSIRPTNPKPYMPEAL